MKRSKMAIFEKKEMTEEEQVQSVLVEQKTKFDAFKAKCTEIIQKFSLGNIAYETGGQKQERDNINNTLGSLVIFLRNMKKITIKRIKNIINSPKFLPALVEVREFVTDIRKDCFQDDEWKRRLHEAAKIKEEVVKIINANPDDDILVDVFGYWIPKSVVLHPEIYDDMDNLLPKEKIMENIKELASQEEIKYQERKAQELRERKRNIFAESFALSGDIENAIEAVLKQQQ